MENLRVPTTFKLDWSRYYYTHTNACPQKTSRTFMDISPTLPIWKRSCQPFRSYRRVRCLVYLRLGGWLSSDPSLHILVVTTPDLHPTHLPNTNRTSSKRPPLDSKARSSQETSFPPKIPKPETHYFLLNKRRVCRQEGVKKSVARICTALTPPPSERAQVCGLGLRDTSPPTRRGAAAVS